jgi:hypothetical protein
MVFMTQAQKFLRGVANCTQPSSGHLILGSGGLIKRCAPRNDVIDRDTVSASPEEMPKLIVRRVARIYRHYSARPQSICPQLSLPRHPSRHQISVCLCANRQV